MAPAQDSSDTTPLSTCSDSVDEISEDYPGWISMPDGKSLGAGRWVPCCDRQSYQKES